MEFIDWRKSPQKIIIDSEEAKQGIKRNKHYRNVVEQQIRQAQESGAFDNLPGTGKPLDLEQNPYAGDKAFVFSWLKNNGFAPEEVEIGRDVRRDLKKFEQRLTRMQHYGKRLKTRRVSPFPSERRGYNLGVEKLANEYDEKLRELNRKILTLNLIAPSSMHLKMYPVEKMVQEFRESCPLLPEDTSRL